MKILQIKRSRHSKYDKRKTNLGELDTQSVSSLSHTIAQPQRSDKNEKLQLSLCIENIHDDINPVT